MIWVVEKSKRTHPLEPSFSGKVFVMLQAYMDDSGTHDGSHNCVVAGYWGGVNEWKRFERSWKAVLNREGIEEFKANEFWPRIDGERVGPYRGWNDVRHRQFIIDLLKVIVGSKIIPFGCGVLGAEWNLEPISFRQLITLADSSVQAKPLLLPFQRNIYRVASYCYPGVRMHFVFDECKKKPHIKSGIVRCFDSIKDGAEAEKDQLRHKLGSLSFEDSKIATPLQAADLLAYEMHRFGKQKDHSVAGMRDVYKVALMRMKTNEDFWLFDEPRFKTIYRVLSEYAYEKERSIDSIQFGDGHDSES